MSMSPFSLDHNWTLQWTKVPEHMKPYKHIYKESPKEKRALEALACIGVIGGLQLSRLFSLDKKRKKKMVAEKKLVRHDIKKNNQVIPVYTLGINGAAVAGVPGYVNNYWLKYRVEDMLKRLLFFQLYEYFPESRVSPAPEPFIGSIFYLDRPIYIYVIRGDVQDLMLYLKWREFNERIIIITESLNCLQPLMLGEDLKLRVTTDSDLKVNSIGDPFYIQRANGSWMKENVAKKIHIVK
jgi:hypothetical protein